MTRDTEFMQQAIDLAWQARQEGNHPFGALLIVDDKVILTAKNSVNTDHDVTRHAELNLVSEASRLFPAEILGQASLYTSTEPCAMCAGAIFWAGIPRVIYGCSAQTLGELAGGAFVIPCRELFGRGAPLVEVIGPVLPDAAARVHENFWN